MLDKLSRFNRAFDFVTLYFIFSGSLYFLYYIFQFNKLIYLLSSVLIYVVSYFVRRFLIKEKNNSGFTEVGMFFVSMMFLGYTLYLFKIDEQIVNYLPDKLLVNSGAVFIFLLLMNLLPKRESEKLSILAILALLAIIIFRGKLDLIFYTYPWVVSLIIGTPYIYLLSILSGIHKSG